MKGKLTIPAQEIKIQIPEQVIIFDFQPIWEMEPPKPEPIPEQPPIVVPTPPIQVNEVFDFDEYLKGKEGVVRMPESMNGKEVIIRSKGMIKPEKVTALIGKNIIPTFENWSVTPNQLIDLAGCREFGIAGITFVCPLNRPIVTAFPDKEVFGWGRDTVDFGKFAYINGQEIKDKERVTFGLCRFGYSSKAEAERIYLIGKNLWHNGFVFTQIKNPYKGNLWLILENVNIHNPIIESPQTHKYSPTSIPVKVKVENGLATIISGNTFDEILQGDGFNYKNQRSLLYFGRYVYDISEKSLLSNKSLIIDFPDEWHPNDNIEGKGKVIRKQIDNSRETNWVYEFEFNDLPTNRTLPSGEFDALIIYKGNALFNNGHLTANTKFPNPEITQSQGYGWSWYNQEFSGHIRNFNGSGFFRNSSGSGITQGLSIVDSQFGLNPPIATANEAMPKESKDYIKYLEQLL